MQGPHAWLYNFAGAFGRDDPVACFVGLPGCDAYMLSRKQRSSKCGVMEVVALVRIFKSCEAIVKLQYCSNPEAQEATPIDSGHIRRYPSRQF